MLGFHFDRSDAQPNLNLCNHRVGIFLYRYFRDEPEAIAQLSGVTVASIDRVPSCEQNAIIALKPPRPPPAPSPEHEQEEEAPLRASPPLKRTRMRSPSPPPVYILGQNEHFPGEMWQ